MDETVCKRILEFLLRESISDEDVVNALIALPVSLLDGDSSIKKAILLRAIQSEIEYGSSMPESVLEKFELIEALDCIDGIAVSDSMKAAYCTVAVDCTLKYVRDRGVLKKEYHGVVKRIWSRKVKKMERASGLFTEELGKWRDKFNEALTKERVRTDLWKKKRYAMEDAWNYVKAYLEEAWAILGPSYLESEAEKKMGKQPGLMKSYEGTPKNVMKSSEINCSPLHILDATILTDRRKVVKWSALEKETLRNAVKQIGEGSWKNILAHHRNIFALRTEVDLKDKWRNMKDK